MGCRCVRAPTCESVDAGFGPAGVTSLHAEKVADGLEVPWSLAFLPNGDMLVTERPGRIRLVESGHLLPDPVALVETDPNGEGGLQGLALHPDFEQNRQFFIFFTVEQGGVKENRVERWQLSQDGHHATFERRLLSGLPGAQFHHGGRLHVGPDKKLYVSVGDARVPDSAQDRGSRAGKLLRITLDGEIPTDNPRADDPVFLLGLRNSEGFDWLDAKTLVVTDHGPSGELGRTGHDEVSIASAGDNLGWPTAFGCQAQIGMVTPLLTWVEAVPPGGAAVYTGDRIPGWKGSLIMGTLGSRHLHRVVFDSKRERVEQHETYFLGDPPSGYGRLREVVMGPDGYVYVTTSNCDGRGTCPPEKDQILRVGPPAP